MASQDMLGQLVFVAWAKVDENVKLQSQIHVQCHLSLTQCHGLLKSPRRPSGPLLRTPGLGKEGIKRQRDQH